MRQLIDDKARAMLRPHIFECFKRLGKDTDRCEQCGTTDKRLEIHHTKYEGATVRDLQLVCRSCNLKGTNKGLA